MAIATSRSFSRGILARYGSLALASGIFFVAIFFLFQTLFKQKDLIERQSRVNIWFLAQTEIEYLNFIEAFDQFALDDKHMTKDGLTETVTALVHRLEALEPALTRVSREDRAELTTLRQSFSALHEPLREMV